MVGLLTSYAAGVRENVDALGERRPRDHVNSRRNRRAEESPGVFPIPESVRLAGGLDLPSARTVVEASRSAVVPTDQGK